MRKAILKEIFEASLIDPLTAERLSQEGVEIFIKARSEVDLYPGVEQTLKELAQNYDLGL